MIDAIIFSKAVNFKIPRDLHLHARQISQGLGINSGSSGLRRRFLHSLGYNDLKSRERSEGLDMPLI